MRTICLVRGCGKFIHARGLCPKHLHRDTVHGSPYVVVKPGHKKGILLSKETRRKMSLAHSTNGYRHSTRTRLKMSESMRLGYLTGRPLAATANLRNNETGFYTSKKMHKRYEYKSKTIEKPFMESLDADRTVRWWFYEPFSIPYWYRGKLHSYFLDFVVWYRSGDIDFVETKHSTHLKQEKVVAKRAGAEILAEQLGAKYRFVTEKELH
jgi:TnsA endonuclease-like protein/NUMOD3 motif-containing protein